MNQLSAVIMYIVIGGEACISEEIHNDIHVNFPYFNYLIIAFFGGITVHTVL